MSHTPGPWVTKGFKIWEERKFGQARAGIVGEASLPWHDSETTEANARLIAAAPDLLEALRNALPFLHAYKEMLLAKGECADLDAILTAEAAIAKARET